MNISYFFWLKKLSAPFFLLEMSIFYRFFFRLEERARRETTPLLMKRDAWRRVGDTSFGPVAEGARRQDVRNNEADVKSKCGDGPSLWIFGSEDEDTRRPGDTSVVTRSNHWAPRSSSIRTKRAAWSCGPFWAVPHPSCDMEITCTSGNIPGIWPL